MATSGSVDYALTSRGIVTAALEIAGVIGIGDTPSAEEATAGLKHLNLLLKTWSTQGNLFIRAEGSVTLSASTASYTASPVSLARRIVAVRRRVSDIDTVLEPFSRQEYLETPNKAGTGTPTAWYFDPQRATRTLYVWPAPTTAVAASTTLRIDYERVIEDSDALDDDPDVPQEWLEALTYSLAARLILPFRRYAVDPAGAAEIKDRAAQLYAQLAADSDESVSVFIQPA